MQQTMTMRDRAFAPAGVRRTPGELATGGFSHQASVGRRLFPLLACFALLVGCGDTPSDPDTAERSEDSHATATSEAINDALGEGAEPLSLEIPEVNAATIKALRRQAEIQKKVLVVDCWATWCSSCVAMFPHLHQAVKERGDGVIMMSLSFDEGEALAAQAGEFLTEQDAWDNAYRAVEGSDAKDALAKALSDTWDGGVLPAVFVFHPDGSLVYEMLETRGEVKDWVADIQQAVDIALNQIDGPTLVDDLP